MINDTYTICITDDDSVEGITEKIKDCAEPKVNLVAFSHTSAVLSIVNLKFFKKIAENAGKTISVSTNDGAVKILAEKTGIPLSFFPSGSKPKISAEAGDLAVQAAGPGINRGKNFPNFRKRPRLVDSIGFEKMPSAKPFRSHAIIQAEIYSPKKISEFSVSGSGKKIFVLFLALAIIAAAAVGYILLPTAKITIVPKTQPVSANFEFVLDKNIAALNKTDKEIPATVMVAEAEKSGQFNATGKKEVSAKATGIVTVYNECSTTPRSLKSSNPLLAANGKLFYTTKAIVVPGMAVEDAVVTPGSIDVPIIAAKAGSEYNIDPTNFIFTALQWAKCQKITAKSSTATSGGALGYATVVSESDLKKAKEFLESEAKKDLLAELDKKRPSDLVLLPEVISIKSEDLTTGAKIDQVTNKFQADLKTSAIAFLFREADVKEIANDIFLDAGKEKKDYVILDTRELAYSNPQILSPDKIKLSAEARTIAYHAIDAAKIKKNLLGKSQSEVENYVKNGAPEIDKITISLWPLWVKKTPILERNIAVTVVLDLDK